MGAKIISLLTILIAFSITSSITTTAENSPPIVNLGENFTVFVGEEIDFTKNIEVSDPDEDSLTYSWDYDANVDKNDDGNTSNDNEWHVIAIVRHTYYEPGNYTVTLTVRDDQHNVTDSLIVTVLEKPGESGTLYTIEDKITDTIEIREEGYIAYKVELNKEERLKISITVIKGPKVYTFMLGNNTTYQIYKKQNPNIYQFDKGSKKDILSISYNWKAPKKGVYYLAIDNNFIYTIDPNGTATCMVTLEKLPKEAPGFEGLATIIAIFSVILIIRKRKR